ncbi:MAG: hypothetical protein HOY78_07675 [Saccharothrix sp.]|nr:hypothetical protein [Saccharothrix sp.]
MTAGRAGKDALAAFANADRDYARRHSDLTRALDALHAVLTNWPAWAGRRGRGQG